LTQDAKVAEKLLPHGYIVGIKRICGDTDSYAMFSRPNVTLVDVREDDGACNGGRDRNRARTLPGGSNRFRHRL